MENINIHSTAIIHPGAKLSPGVSVGPYSIVGGEVVLGDRVRLRSHVVVDGRTTIGAGTVTYIVGPVTGTAIGASSEVITLAIAVGVFKAILVMVSTPMLATELAW